MNIGNEMKTAAISSLAKMLTNKDTWLKVIGHVKELEDSTLTGSERKKKAIEYLKEDFADFGTLLLNVIIELGVLFIRLKFGVVI